jgi:hypothetical protein
VGPYSWLGGSILHCVVVHMMLTLLVPLMLQSEVLLCNANLQPETQVCREIIRVVYRDGSVHADAHGEQGQCSYASIVMDYMCGK